MARERAQAEQRRRSAEGRARAQAEKVAAPPPKAVAPPPVQAWGGAAAQKPEPAFSLNDDFPPPSAPASPPAPARLLDLSASRPLAPPRSKAADDVDDLLRAAMDVTLDDSDPRVPTRRAAAPIGPPGVGAIGRAPGRRAPVDEPPASSGGWGFGAAGPQLGAVGLPWAGLAGVRAENPVASANPSPFGGF